MALEKRNGNLYYYRSIRDGERVLKVYLGAGEFGRIIAESDVLRRTGREAQRRLEQAELERLETLAAPILELDEAADVLVRAALVAQGMRRHKGEWRHARNT